MGANVFGAAFPDKLLSKNFLNLLTGNIYIFSLRMSISEI